MALNKLNHAKIKSISEPCQLCDGGGLWLIATRSKLGHINIKWAYRYKLGKNRKMGLGTYPDVSLAAARELAAGCRDLVRQKIDPIDHRNSQNAEKLEAIISKSHTFERCAQAYINAHRSGWSNEKHIKQWSSTLKQYAYPLIGSTDVKDITTGMVLEVIEPIWSSKNETANRVRQRIEKVLEWAAVKNYRSRDNPAQWRGHLDHLLPKPGKVKKVKHFQALPWRDVPMLYSELRSNNCISSKALQITILTAKRTSEVLWMKEAEFDLDAGIWNIPAGRMKSKRPHREPLADETICLIKKMKMEMIAGCDYLIPGSRGNKPINQVAMIRYLQRDLGYTGITVHGFRSAFRDWVADSTNYPGELAESCLSHVLSNKTEAAYQRSDMLERRRELMQAWANHVTAKS